MADEYPSAQVVGIDISPHQLTWVPPNLEFVVDDIDDAWGHGSGFDLAYFRNMALVLRDPQKIIDEVFM